MNLQHVSHEGRIHARTPNSSYEGLVVMSGATRLKEFINRQCPTLVLHDVEVMTAPVGTLRPTERFPAVTLYKSQILYATLVEEIRQARARVYERDVLAAHLKKELFAFQLDGGVLVTGEVVGGEHSISFPRGAFLAVVNPTVTTLRGTDLLGNLNFVLINLGRVEYFRALGGGVAPQEAREEAQEEAREPAAVASEELDFSDLEAQFVRIERLDAKPST